MAQPSRKAIAYHEAGHTVALIAEGLQIYEVSILQSWGLYGAVAHPGPSRLQYKGARARRTGERALLVAAYAGFEAEKTLDPSADEESKHARRDRGEAERQSADWGIGPKGCTRGDVAFRAYHLRLRTKARRLVKQHWSAVERVAAALLEKEVLTGKEAKAIVEGETA